MPASRPSSAPASRRKPTPVSRAELARLTGRARSSITEAASGALKPACLGAGRIDASHPAVLKYAGVSSYAELISGAASKRIRPAASPSPLPALIIQETAPTLASFAAEVGRPAAIVERDLPDAIIPEHHLDVNTFASLAGCPAAHVVQAAAGELAAAVTSTGRLDASCPAALAWFGRHPFMRTVAGDAVVGSFPLAPACDGDLIDTSHWLARIFLARLGPEVDA